MSKKHLPLEGLRVVELGTHVAVPNAARFLADWGAEVVKVEGLSGDAWRVVGRNQLCPILDEENPLFTLQNANKSFISIDLKDPTGMEMFLKLIARFLIIIVEIRITGTISPLRVGRDKRDHRNPVRFFQRDRSLHTLYSLIVRLLFRRQNCLFTHILSSSLK